MKKDQFYNSNPLIDSSNMGKNHLKRKFKLVFLKYKKVFTAFSLFVVFIFWQTVFQDSKFI